MSTKTEKAPPKQAPANPQGGSTPVDTTCAAKPCKVQGQRFGFCLDHFEHYKFGLIKKDGKPSLDYDRKLKQFQKMLERKKAA